ncbi:hypothetical protein F0562_011625 [Nyssa sinensis]|uniref:Uncharacterized protein n=1 Tax=Nyssa sinensis TaxID=561372 RepID=A0A5J4ZU88_9ASTE|nr:hypothetical protein F0562_011625 [Nyssa sinensis]
MPRSSRHKSHKQSKHGSKDAREYSDSEEDVKMKERNGEEGSVRVSKDSTSGEKRKVASQLRDGKDPSAHGNGDTAEEFVASKRRKEKADGAAASDRWNGGGGERGDGVTVDKEMKGESSRLDSDKGSKSKVLVDSKSKTSRKHDNFIEKKEENLAAEKDESKSSSRVDSKRKSEKDSGWKEVHQHKDFKESKEKERGPERERKVQDIKRDAEARSVDGEVAKKQGSQSVDFNEERQGKQVKENTEWPIHEELRNTDGEKELEKWTRKRRDGSSDKDKYQDHVRESDDRQLSSRGERVKDGRHKDGSYGDKHREDGDRDDRHRENKYRDDGDRDNRHRDDKYREDSVRDSRHRDGGSRDNRHRDDKYREDGDRDNRQSDDKYREEVDRDNRHKDDKYREDGDRDNRHRDDKYWKDGDKDNRNSEDKHREDVDRDSRRRDGKQREDVDRDKRLRDVKYRDDRTSRDRSNDKSDAKRLRDESNAGELHYRKSTNRDGSPIYEDQRNSNKDDKGKRRASDKEDKEDRGDMRYRSTKEQRSDTEKKSSAKVESVTDRGRSYSRNTDVDITPNRSRRRSSPSSSSHAGKDHYRLSKQEGSRYRDYAHEDRVRHDVNSSKEFIGVAGVTEKVSKSWSMEKPVPKDDSHLSEFSVERRQKSDSRTSPLHLVDKSPSSSSTDRRHLNKSDARRSLDVEESGQRSGGSRDARDYSDKEGRGSRETHLVDEFSQADGDTLSVSSPFSRTNRLPSNSKSLLPPPPPFRTGVDNPLIFGSSEDDSRGRPHNRNRRIGDSSMGRGQGSAWKGVPNWPSPVANGFIPFQHGPPTVSFHPVMQQFPAPPMFGVRPSMELNHTGYHIPDADRFSGHGRPLGWRNPVDDSCPPPLHGWDANNAIFGDESHIYGRPDWDHNRTLTSGRGWEASGEMWKGQNGGVSTELPSAPQKQDYSVHGSAEEVWTGQSVKQAQNEQNQTGLRAESFDVNQFSDGLASNNLEASKSVPKETTNIPKTSRKDDDHLWHVYLSKLDISADLTHPELYDQCTRLMDINQNLDSDKDDSKILFVEEIAGAEVAISNKASSASLFAATNDSVFQKAMSLYKKQREEIRAINGEKIPLSTVENLEFVPTIDPEKLGSTNDKPGELVPSSCDQIEAEGAVSNSIQEKAELPDSFQKLEASPETMYQKAGEPISPNSVEKSEEPISTLNTVKMEVDPVLNQETMEQIVENKSLSLENLELSDAHPCVKVEDVNQASDSGGNNSANNNEEQNLVDIKCGTLLFSDVSSEACEPVMPESIECGSVNLSRIHHSPESTH